MPYEFLAKNGLISQGNVTVTGSLITSQNVTASNISASGTIIATSFTGSFSGSIGTAINATSASYALSASYAPTNTNITASWATNSLTASYLTPSNIYTVAGLSSGYVEVTGIATIPNTGIYRPAGKTLGLSADGTLILKIDGNASPYVTSIETGNFIVPSGSVGIGVVSPVNKLDINGNISASVITASFFGTSSWATNAVTASFVSNAFVQGGNSFGTTALLGTNDANSLAFETNGSTRMTINSGGFIGVNTSPTLDRRFNISDTHNGSLGSSSLYIATGQNQNQGLATSANDSGITNLYTVNNFTSSAAIQNQASFNQMIIAGSGSFSGSYRAERNGILFSNTASLDSSGNIINTYLTNQISSNIPTFSIPNWVAGTYTYVDLITGNSTGSITNLYNHQISSPFPSGGSGGITVNNSYGIYIAKQKTTNIVTNGWGIYQIDTGDLNIFAGKTRIGSTTVPVNTLDVTGNISASVVTASLFFGTASFATTASSLVAANSYTVTNLTASNVLRAAKIAEKVVTFTPLTGSLTGAPAWYRIISGSGVLDSGRVRMSANYDNSRSDIEFTYAVRNYDTDGAGAFINITRASTYNSVFNAVRVIEGTLTTPYAIDVLIGNYLNNTTPDTVTCLYESQFIGAVLDTPTFVSASATGSNSNVVKTVYTTYASGYPRIGPTYSDGLAVATVQGQLTVGYRGNYAYNAPSTNNYALLVSGSVGIGTTSPGEKLTVSGSSYIIGGTGAVGTGTAYYLGDSSNKDISLTRVGAASLAIGRYFPSAWVETIRFTADGNVGIGTTSPGYKLDVYTSDQTIAGFAGTNSSQIVRFGNSAATQYTDLIMFVAGGSGEIFRNGSANSSFGGASSLNIWNSNGPIAFHPNNTTNAMFLSSAGNVGIGTTSPVARLSVVPSGSAFDSSNTMVAYFAKTTANGYGSTFIRVARYDNTTTTGSNAEYTDIEYNSGGSTPFRYGTYADTNIINGFASTNGVYGSINFVTSGSTRMTIAGGTSAGNVGIGTSSPVAKLQVAGNVSGSSFTSSISNAVGFLGTSSWAQNVVSASFATTAQTANALNASNTYTIAGLTSAYVDVNGSGTIPTTGIYRPSTKTLGLSADGTLIFKISNVSSPATSSIETGNFIVQSGNVGIGTTTTPLKLNVSGSIYMAAGNGSAIDWSSDISSQFLKYDSGIDGMILSSWNNTTFYTQQIERVRINSAGNVGIGTTLPASKFHISGSGQTIMRLDSDTTTNVSQFQIKAASDAVLIMGMLGGSAASTNFGVTAAGQAYFGTTTLGSPHPTSLVIGNASNIPIIFSTNNIERMRIDSVGNVGIGTTSANNKLEVIGGTNTRINLGNIDDANRGGKLEIISGSVTARQFYVGTNSAIYNLVFGIDSVEKMRLDTNGNVGIGVTSPSGRLHITGSATASETLLYLSKGSGSITQNYINAVNQAGQVNYRAASDLNGHLSHEIYYNGTVKVSHNTYWPSFINNDSYTNGGLGIGTTSTTHGYGLTIAKPSTSGSLYVSGSTIITGSLNVSTNITCLSLTETSTQAVKYNILPLSSQLDNVMKLKPVSFNYKTNDKHSIGLIAEEVAKIYPEFTSENNDSISYGKITSVLIQSIKELKNIIDNQQKQIEDLSNKLKQF